MNEYIIGVPVYEPGKLDSAVVNGKVIGELVRCKDCKYKALCGTREVLDDNVNGFCSDGRGDAD